MQEIIQQGCLDGYLIPCGNQTTNDAAKKVSDHYPGSPLLKKVVKK